VIAPYILLVKKILSGLQILDAASRNTVVELVYTPIELPDKEIQAFNNVDGHRHC
jgi:hypothetical protein